MVVPDYAKKLESAVLFNITLKGSIETIPFIMFMFMYQTVLPQLYKELKEKSLHKMEGIIRRASSGMIGVYFVVGIFGYLTFAD